MKQQHFVRNSNSFVDSVSLLLFMSHRALVSGSAKRSRRLRESSARRGSSPSSRTCGDPMVWREAPTLVPRLVTVMDEETRKQPGPARSQEQMVHHGVAPLLLRPAALLSVHKPMLSDQLETGVHAHDDEDIPSLDAKGGHGAPAYVGISSGALEAEGASGTTAGATEAAAEVSTAKETEAETFVAAAVVIQFFIRARQRQREDLRRQELKSLRASRERERKERLKKLAVPTRRPPPGWQRSAPFDTPSALAGYASSAGTSPISRAATSNDAVSEVTNPAGTFGALRYVQRASPRTAAELVAFRAARAVREAAEAGVARRKEAQAIAQREAQREAAEQAAELAMKAAAQKLAKQELWQQCKQGSETISNLLTDVDRFGWQSSRRCALFKAMAEAGELAETARKLKASECQGLLGSILSSASKRVRAIERNAVLMATWEEEFGEEEQQNETMKVEGTKGTITISDSSLLWPQANVTSNEDESLSRGHSTTKLGSGGLLSFEMPNVQAEAQGAKLAAAWAESFLKRKSRILLPSAARYSDARAALRAATGEARLSTRDARLLEVWQTGAVVRKPHPPSTPHLTSARAQLHSITGQSEEADIREARAAEGKLLPEELKRLRSSPILGSPRWLNRSNPTRLAPPNLAVAGGLDLVKDSHGSQSHTYPPCPIPASPSAAVSNHRAAPAIPLSKGLPPVQPVPLVCVHTMRLSRRLVLLALTRNLRREAEQKVAVSFGSVFFRRSVDLELEAARSAFKSWGQDLWIDPRTLQTKPKSPHSWTIEQYALLGFSAIYAERLHLPRVAHARQAMLWVLRCAPGLPLETPSEDGCVDEGEEGAGPEAKVGNMYCSGEASHSGVLTIADLGAGTCAACLGAHLAIVEHAGDDQPHRLFPIDISTSSARFVDAFISLTRPHHGSAALLSGQAADQYLTVQEIGIDAMAASLFAQLAQRRQRPPHLILASFCLQYLATDERDGFFRRLASIAQRPFLLLIITGIGGIWHRPSAQVVRSLVLGQHHVTGHGDAKPRSVEVQLCLVLPQSMESSLPSSEAGDSETEAVQKADPTSVLLEAEDVASSAKNAKDIQLNSDQMMSEGGAKNGMGKALSPPPSPQDVHVNDRWVLKTYLAAQKWIDRCGKRASTTRFDDSSAGSGDFQGISNLLAADTPSLRAL